MRALVLTICLALAACDRCSGEATTSGGVKAPPKDVEVELVTGPGAAPLALDAKAKDALRAHVEHALEICNFRSDKHGIPFKGQDLDTLWSDRAAMAHVSVRYPAPHTVRALAGDVAVTDVLLAFGTSYGPEPALVRADGKVIGLAMCGYDDRTLACSVPELAKLVPPAGPCPPALAPSR